MKIVCAFFHRLENALRNFACLTTGDVIAINYNEKVRLKMELFQVKYWITTSDVFASVWLLMRLVCLFQIYELRVMETKPDKAVSIIECDMNVSRSICFLLH